MNYTNLEAYQWYLLAVLVLAMAIQVLMSL